MQAVLLEEGAKVSKAATDGILSASEQMHEEFAARGGKLSVLEGAELEKLRKLEREKVEPLLAEEVDEHVFAALKRFTGR